MRIDIRSFSASWQGRTADDRFNRGFAPPLDEFKDMADDNRDVEEEDGKVV